MQKEGRFRIILPETVAELSSGHRTLENYPSLSRAEARRLHLESGWPR